MLTTKYTNRLSFISNIFFINHGNKIILYISKYIGNLPISIPPEKDDIKYNNPEANDIFIHVSISFDFLFIIFFLPNHAKA